MKIFSAAQIRQWDAFTIENEPVLSIDLMERAATACFNWLRNHFDHPSTYTVFCGSGNNGGDGLAIARMLLQAGDTVSIYILEGEKRSADFSKSLERWSTLPAPLQYINDTDFHVIPADTIVIDALFGSGLSRPLHGLAADMVNCINEVCKTIISIDIPTGLFADENSAGNIVINASHTLSFQTPKLAFFIAGNNKYTGSIHLLDIGLHADFYHGESTTFNTLDKKLIQSVYKPRNQFSHKYDFGHALLYAGSKNMMGAAVLCSKACLRSGAGLVTAYTENDTQQVIQTALPEAITTTDNDVEKIWKKKSAIGIGPGLELSNANKDLLFNIITNYQGKLVIDASALQLLAENTTALQHRSFNPAILTPHTGEFEKMFGKSPNEFERTKTAIRLATELNSYIVLKGHHTLVACPGGYAFFNTTGNAGMATAGSGDVLTGILTGLLAQGYSQQDACLLGVYLHGVAGDIAAEKISQEAMISGDIIDYIGEAYKKIQNSDDEIHFPDNHAH
ncbi:MAG: NAD(P)H-hydrate dehydratase [Ferruginibacter sp.]